MSDVRLFGTDGIRGRANEPPMTAEMALAVGRAVVARSRGLHGALRPRFVIGRDTRQSGPMLESALAAGICSAGGDALRAGVLPTPGIAFLARERAATAGIVVSASHNPFSDNGIKLFSAQGRKLPDAEEAAIESLIRPFLSGSPTVGGSEIGTIEDIAGADADYVTFCAQTFPGPSFAGMRLVLDCAHGATYKVAPLVFSGLGAQVTVMNHQPDGININEECGSEHPEGLSRRVKESGAEVGLAFDGDGDRVIAVDERGVVLTGDQVIAVCARMYQDRGWLENGLVVSTVMSNLGLRRALQEWGMEHLASRVGDRYVVELMDERGAAIGGEDSGHIVFSRHHTTGDGIVAGLQLLAAMRFYRRPLSDLAAMMVVYPQTVVNVDVTVKPPLGGVPGLSQAMAEAEAELGEHGRLLIRYSGTQPMCRVMVEGRSVEVIERLAGELADVIRRELG